MELRQISDFTMNSVIIEGLKNVNTFSAFMSIRARVLDEIGLRFLFKNMTYSNSTAPFFILWGISSELEDKLIPVDIRFHSLAMHNNTI